jgi:hypothetical protein
VLAKVEAAAELLERRKARNSLEGFTRYTKPDYRVAPHHKTICEALEAIERGDIDRLALFTAPRHGKSELASRRFPAWYLGRNPNHQIICASYSAELANDFGRDVRNIVASREYKAVFPDVSLAPDSQAANRWHTSDGGVYVSAGIGGSLTGKGAHVALIDDPVKDQQEADSDISKRRTWDWYASVLRTRLMPKGKIVLIQTRWSEDDLAGRILSGPEAGRWHVVTLPAIVDGKALWPEAYPLEELESIKALDHRKFSALYMQNPTPDDGTFFKRGWFEFVDPKKVTGHRYTTGDFAVTEGDGDYTEIGTHAYQDDVLTLAVDGWRGQTTADVWIEQMIDQFARHRPLCFFGESGPIRRSIEPFLNRRMAERRQYCRTEWLVRGSDKATMARSLQAMAARGKVRVADTEYGHHLLAQLLQFPAGKYDDAVDMATLMGMAIADVHPALTASKDATKPVDRYATRDSYDEDWKVA